MSNRNIFKSDYFYSILAKGLHIILGVFITVFVNRALGAELKGQYAYIHNIVTVVVIIGGLGIYQLYPFYHRKHGTDIREKFMSIMFLILLFYILILIVLTPIILIIDINSQTKILFFLVFLNVIFQVLSTELNMLSSIENFIKCKKRDIVLNILRFSLFLIMYLFFKKNIIAVFLVDITYHVVLIFSMLYILSIRKISLKVEKTLFKEVLKKGFFPMLFTLLLSFNYNLDIIYMKNFTGVSLIDIGLYSVGVQFIGYLWTIPDIFKEVLYSKTAKDDSIKDILYCIKISIHLEILIWLFFVILGSKIIVFLYGKEFIGSTSIIWIMIFGILSMTLFKILTPLYNAKGNFKYNLFILFISVVINMILNVILITKYGIIGAAIASVFGYTVCGIWYLIRFTREYKIPFKDIVFINKNDIHYVHKRIKLVLGGKNNEAKNGAK